MDARRVPTRAIGVLVPLVLSALLLFNHLSFLQPDGRRITDSSDRSAPLGPESARLTTIESSLGSIVLPSGRQDYAFNLTSSHPLNLLEPPHLLPRDALSYGVAVCYGIRNWRMITDAFAGGHDPGRDFTFDDLDNGWDTEEDNQFLENHWQAPLKYISNQLDDVEDNTVPDPDDINFVELRQDKEFVNDEGRQTVSFFISSSFSRAFSFALSLLSPLLPSPSFSPCSRLLQPRLTFPPARNRWTIPVLSHAHPRHPLRHIPLLPPRQTTILPYATSGLLHPSSRTSLQPPLRRQLVCLDPIRRGPS